jgi:protein-disulfide isomerase/uncharacterized membrane protein
MRVILASLSILGLFICLKLITVSVASTSCGFTGCDAVLSSSYSNIFGISLASLGFGFYSVCLFLISQNYIKSLLRWMKAGCFVVLLLFLIQLIVIKAWCAYCLLSSLIIVVMLLILIKRPLSDEPVFTLKTKLLIALLLFVGIGVESLLRHSLRETTTVLTIDNVHYSLSDVDRELGLSGADLERQKNELRHKWLRAKLLERELEERSITKAQLYTELIGQYKSDIMSGLKQYEDSLFEKYNVSVNFPVPSIVEISDNRFGSISPSDKKEFHIVEFIDLECGHCRTIHKELKALKEAHPERVSIEIRHFPLASHQHSKKAAQIAWCMNNQQLGYEYIDAAFSQNRALNEALLIQVALDSGANKDALFACVAEPHSFEAIKEDISIGKDIGVSGTPAVFVNNQFVRSIDDIQQMILNAR